MKTPYGSKESEWPAGLRSLAEQHSLRLPPMQRSALYDAWNSAEEALEDQDYLADNEAIDPEDPRSMRVEIVERLEGPVHDSSSWLEASDPRGVQLVSHLEARPKDATAWRNACTSLATLLRLRWGFPESGPIPELTEPIRRLIATGGWKEQTHEGVAGVALREYGRWLSLAEADTIARTKSDLFESLLAAGRDHLPEPKTPVHES